MEKKVFEKEEKLSNFFFLKVCLPVSLVEQTYATFGEVLRALARLSTVSRTVFSLIESNFRKVIRVKVQKRD